MLKPLFQLRNFHKMPRLGNCHLSNSCHNRYPVPHGHCLNANYNSINMSLIQSCTKQLNLTLVDP